MYRVLYAYSTFIVWFWSGQGIYCEFNLGDSSRFTYTFARGGPIHSIRQQISLAGQRSHNAPPLGLAPLDDDVLQVLGTEPRRALSQQRLVDLSDILRQEGRLQLEDLGRVRDDVQPPRARLRQGSRLQH